MQIKLLCNPNYIIPFLKENTSRFFIDHQKKILALFLAAVGICSIFLIRRSWNKPKVLNKADDQKVKLVGDVVQNNNIFPSKQTEEKEEMKKKEGVQPVHANEQLEQEKELDEFDEFDEVKKTFGSQKAAEPLNELENYLINHPNMKDIHPEILKTVAAHFAKKTFPMDESNIKNEVEFAFNGKFKSIPPFQFMMVKIAITTVLRYYPPKN